MLLSGGGIPNERSIMSYRKSRLAGVLIAAALGVLAFASSAQAITELASGFFINGAQVGALKASFTKKQLGRGTLAIPALNTEINCEKFSVTNGFINSTTDGEGTFLYEECSVLTITGGLVEQPCNIVVTHTGDKKHHITATALLLPAELTDGSPAILVEFKGKILMEEGTECTLPKTTEIKGEVCFKIAKEGIHKNETVEPELETNEAIQKSCNPRLTLEGTEFSGTLAEREKLEKEGKGFLDKILFGVNEAFVTAKADIALSGVHLGKTLGVLLI
jgi:hypothetical protein